MPRVTGRTEGEPHSRLTRIADAMTEVLDHHPEAYPSDRAIVLVENDGGDGGIGLTGFDDAADALASLLVHAQVLADATGKKLMMVPISDG
jgi:hypothetical protein